MDGTDIVTEPRGYEPPSTPMTPNRERGRAEDDDLVEGILGGDDAAFERLYRKHCGAVFGLALRMLRNREDAEDLLQEIFLQVHDKLPTFAGRSAFGTWLHRLAVNRCLDHLRSRGAKEQSRTDPLPEMLSSGRSPEGARGLELERAIGFLPPSSRAAFLLHDVAGYDHREVGSILGVAVGTSKSLVHRARMKLRDQLKTRSAGAAP